MSEYPEFPGWRDPETSRESAQAIADETPHLRAIVLASLRAAPATVHETAAYLGRSVPSIQPRFSELRKMGLIQPTGEKRVNAASRHRAHVWKITPPPPSNMRPAQLALPGIIPGA